jgi:hypothetical protein
VEGGVVPTPFLQSRTWVHADGPDPRVVEGRP